VKASEVMFTLQRIVRLEVNYEVIRRKGTSIPKMCLLRSGAFHGFVVGVFVGVVVDF
jgi:hypothetical protein